VKGGHDQAVGGPQLRALDLPAQDAEFMPQQEHLCLGIIWPKPDISDVQQEPKT